MHKSLFFSLAAASSAIAAPYCTSKPVPCNDDSCSPCFCLGPDNVIANSPVNPRTCNGDFSITVAGLYWIAHEDGLEYAVDNNTSYFASTTANNNLIDAEYLSPKFKADTGFRVGLGYSSPCDGWDIALVWTYFRGKASSHDEAELDFSASTDEQHLLLPLWSAFNGFLASTKGGLIASDIETNWMTDFNITDLELGRQYWVSHYLSFRPFIGLRYVSIDQNYQIQYKGGDFTQFNSNPATAYNDEVELENDFRGLGVRGGFDAYWNFGCGWALYSNLAASIIYGRFNIEHDEDLREAQSPFSKQAVLETEDSFKASRAIVDLALGIQYTFLFCECKYGFTARLAYEQHLFFHQNQLWRVVRQGLAGTQQAFRNNQGENVHFQRRGTLDTSGLTLSLRFDF